MYTLEVLNPVAVSKGELLKTSAAPRPDSLAGKRVGLLWNAKRGGNIGLARVGELLQSRHPDIKLLFVQGTRGFSPAVMQQAVKECDVVVGSTGD